MSGNVALSYPAAPALLRFASSSCDSVSAYYRRGHFLQKTQQNRSPQCRLGCERVCTANRNCYPSSSPEPSFTTVTILTAPPSTPLSCTARPCHELAGSKLQPSLAPCSTKTHRRGCVRPDHSRGVLNHGPTQSVPYSPLWGLRWPLGQFAYIMCPTQCYPPPTAIHLHT